MQKHKVYIRQKSYLYLFILLLLLILFQPTVYGEIVVIKGEQASGHSIQNGGHYSFNKIPAYARCDDVMFTIINNGDQAVEFAGEKITLLGTDGFEGLGFEVNYDELSNIILPGDSSLFKIKFISNATDASFKMAQVVFNILNIEGQFTFSISATARSKITYEFKQPGTHYWKAPTQGNVVLTLVGGGGGGGGGSGCPIPRPSPPYEWPSGGGGGGAGEYLRNIFLTLTNTRELIYTISIGSGGFYGQGASERRAVNIADYMGGWGNAGSPTSFIYYNYDPAEKIYVKQQITARPGSGGSPGMISQPYSNGGTGFPGGHGGCHDSGRSEGGDGGNNGLGCGISPEQSGETGPSAPPNSGGGGAGGGGSGGQCSSWPRDGGRGGSGYCKIEWTGFLD